MRLSRGVVGRTTYAMVAFLAVLAIAAARIAPNLLLWLVGIGALTFVVYLLLVMRFANRNPGAALLEGAELLRWQQTELAAKGTGPIASGPAIAPPSERPALEEGKD